MSFKGTVEREKGRGRGRENFGVNHTFRYTLYPHLWIRRCVIHLIK